MFIIDINGSKRECVKAYVDKNYPGYVKVDYKTTRTYSEWYPIDDFLKKNPDLKDLIHATPLTHEDLGVVSSSKKLSLSDRTKNWKKDAYIGFPIWISRGKGEGQMRKVVGNTKNTITIDKNWGVLPDKTSQYVLSYNIHDVQILGNTLPWTDLQK